MSGIRPDGRDAALAAALGVVTVVLTALAAGPDDRPWWPGGVLLILTGTTALVWRGRAPLTVLGVVVASVAPYYWAGYPDGPASLLLAVAVYTVAGRADMRTSLITGATVLLVWLGVEQFVTTVTGPSTDGDRWVWLVVTIATAVAVGGLRRAALAAADRAQEVARRQVESERLRIAREVHDVVSHSLASIAVQAGVGAHVADRRPEQAVAALHAIRDTSRNALDELRAVLAVLRDQDEGAGVRPERRSLDEVDDVRRVARLAGLDLVVRGEAGDLTAAADDAAFRIVREAVTNTVRHARDARRIVVELRRDAATLRLRVSDDGAVLAGAVEPGHGLRGLGELARAHGGHARAEPTAQGFVVTAELAAVDAR